MPEHTGIIEQTPLNGKNGYIKKQMKTLTLRHVMVESAEKWIGLHIINLHTNIKYIPTVSILCSGTPYGHRHYIL